MTYLMARLDVADFDAWKQIFDSDPAGRVQAANGHRICRSTENANELIVQVDFDSAEQAKAFRDRLSASGALDRVKLPAPPIIVEETETIRY